MTSIFISYRRPDSAGHAGRLFDRLRYWFPQDELFLDLDSICWGDNFPEEIERAVRETKAVLIVIGPDWLKEINKRVDAPKIDFVRQEVSIALKRRALGEVEVFPILVGGAEIPDGNSLRSELKDDIGKLLDYQAHEFPENNKLWDTQFERLRECLAKVDGIPCPGVQNSQPNKSDFFTIDDLEPTLPPSLFNFEAVQEAFGTVSNALLCWPQEIESQWIERPELDRLHKLTTRNQTTVTVLLGGPEKESRPFLPASA